MDKSMKPLVTIVGPAHNEAKWNMPFIDSMRAQTNDRWKAVVFHNGYNATLRDMIGFIGDERLTYNDSHVDSGNWGTANRQTTINECTTDYIIQSSIGDYWLPQAVESINKILEKDKPDILIWNSINHVVGPCLMLDAKLAWSKLDWGNFAIRTDIAKAVGINHGDQYCADWLFINDVLNSGYVNTDKILKLNAILTIHN